MFPIPVPVPQRAVLYPHAHQPPLLVLGCQGGAGTEYRWRKPPQRTEHSVDRVEVIQNNALSVLGEPEPMVKVRRGVAVISVSVALNRLGEGLRLVCEQSCKLCLAGSDQARYRVFFHF